MVRTSASTWSPCSKGVLNTRIPCSPVGNDWSPLHTITGGGSTPCLHDMLATNGEHTCTVPQLRLLLIDSDSRVVTKQTRPVHARKPCALEHFFLDVGQIALCLFFLMEWLKADCTEKSHSHVLTEPLTLKLSRNGGHGPHRARWDIATCPWRSAQIEQRQCERPNSSTTEH